MNATTTSEVVPTLTERFRHFAARAAQTLGSPWAFVLAVLVCTVWALSGPVFGYSDTWQLTINTGTTVVTFLAVFVIQNSQNRDAVSIQLKLDELLRAVERARTGLVHLEDFTDEQVEALRNEFAALEREVPPCDSTPEHPPASRA